MQTVFPIGFSSGVKGGKIGLERSLDFILVVFSPDLYCCRYILSLFQKVFKPYIVAFQARGQPLSFYFLRERCRSGSGGIGFCILMITNA